MYNTLRAAKAFLEQANPPQTIAKKMNEEA